MRLLLLLFFLVGCAHKPFVHVTPPWYDGKAYSTVKKPYNSPPRHFKKIAKAFKK